MSAPRRTALVTGIAGGLARLVGADLARRGFRVVGVDYRPLPAPLDYPAEFHQANYNKTRIEDVFRRAQPTHVLHLGRVGNLKEDMGKRFDLNVVGSRKVLELAVKYGAGRVVVLSTFHIYGAHPRNPIPIFEEDPLRAGTEFIQIGDAVQLDSQTHLWALEHPAIPTVLLRPCNVVGPTIHNAISGLVRARLQPVMAGWNPMTQFVHQDDLAAAVVAATEGGAGGVYNVAGESPVPWREALSWTGGRQVPVPSSLAATWLRIAGVFTPTVPPYLVNFFRYPCVIGDGRFRAAFGWRPRLDEREAILSTAGR